jgi:hypothetical protein
MRRWLIMLVLPLITLGLSAPARAQYTNSYGYSFNNPISATANQYFWDGMNRRLLLRMMLKKRGYTDAQLGPMSTAQMKAIIEGGATDTPAATVPAAKPAKTYANATRFKPAKKRLLVGTIVNSLVQDKAQRAQLVELFDGAIKSYETEARKTGFDNDLAGAMAFFIGAAYMVHHDGSEPDDKGLEALAVALREQMATSEMAKIAAADKQKFYELMLVLGTFLLVSYQQATNDHDAPTLASLKAAAGDALRGFIKLDPAAFTITANGLELTPK